MILLYSGFCIILLVALAIMLAPMLQFAQAPLRQRCLMAGSISLVFFAGFFGVYITVGAPEVVSMVEEQQRRIDIIKQAITTLSHAVQIHPEDAQSWMGLGDNFTLTGQQDAAVNAYQQAVKASEGNPGAILAYAQAMVAKADGKVTDEVKQSLAMVLLQDPGNTQARYLMAVGLLQEGKTQDAMKAMRALYRSLPDGDPVKLMIDKQIGK